jgi:hypothetical protein
MASRSTPVDYKIKNGSRDGKISFAIGPIKKGVETMMHGILLLVILVLALIGVLPKWPHSRKWGYFPTGGVGIILLIVVIFLLLGRI